MLLLLLLLLLVILHAPYGHFISLIFFVGLCRLVGGFNVFGFLAIRWFLSFNSFGTSVYVCMCMCPDPLWMSFAGKYFVLLKFVSCCRLFTIYPLGGIWSLWRSGLLARVRMGQIRCKHFFSRKIHKLYRKLKCWIVAFLWNDDDLNDVNDEMLIVMSDRGNLALHPKFAKRKFSIHLENFNDRTLL